VRTDFNVTVGDDGKVDASEDYRLEAALETLQELKKNKCRIVIGTHFGRPEAVKIGEGASGKLPWDLEPIRKRLNELLGWEVQRCDYLFGPEVKAVIESMPDGGGLMLPNLRLDPGEEAGDKSLAEDLVRDVDFYINEAFSNSHRGHASMAVMPKLLPAAAGRRTAQEIKALEKLRLNPEVPYVAIVSGAKIETKVNLLRELLKEVDQVFVAGRIANVFLQVTGQYPEADFDKKAVAVARELWETAGSRIGVPVDVVVGPSFTPRRGTSADKPDLSRVMSVTVDEIPPGVEGVWDIGPKSVDKIVAAAVAAKTVLWNGPVGRVEVPPYDQSTVRLAKELAELKAFRVVGGGDTVNVLERGGLMDKYDHVSVGGGAVVTFLEGKVMPALVPLYV